MRTTTAAASGPARTYEDGLCTHFCLFFISILLQPAKRIAAVEKYIKQLKTKREEIIELLMWEICKNTAAATSEFDRTIKYVEDTMYNRS
jgi:hypothetical protein